MENEHRIDINTTKFSPYLLFGRSLQFFVLFCVSWEIYMIPYNQFSIKIFIKFYFIQTFDTGFAGKGRTMAFNCIPPALQTHQWVRIRMRPGHIFLRTRHRPIRRNLPPRPQPGGTGHIRYLTDSVCSRNESYAQLLVAFISVKYRIRGRTWSSS